MHYNKIKQNIMTKLNNLTKQFTCFAMTKYTDHDIVSIHFQFVASSKQFVKPSTYLNDL